jgi:hypothetical protein
LSEFGQLQELRRRFLRVAYDLGMNRPGRLVALADIAEVMQQYIDTSTSHFVDELIEIARYLNERGWIKKQTVSYEIISITAAGIDEVERESISEPSAPPSRAPTTATPPCERKETRRQFLEAVYDLSGGTPYQYVYWQNVAPRLGWDAENPAHEEQGIAIAQYLADSRLITIEVDEGTIYRITAAGIDTVEEQEAQGTPATRSSTTGESEEVARAEDAPLHIRDSLRRFRDDHPDPATVAFILMQFRDTKPHQAIVEAVKNSLAEHGITGVRADEKEYHEDLFPNVLTYMHGCGMGVAVFEQIEAQSFNPNVALELGYMYAMRKPLCLLKDRNLTTLHSDLVGKLYREFDSYDPAGTIPPNLTKWLTDRVLSGG